MIKKITVSYFAFFIGLISTSAQTELVINTYKAIVDKASFTSYNEIGSVKVVQPNYKFVEERTDFGYDLNASKDVNNFKDAGTNPKNESDHSLLSLKHNPEELDTLDLNLTKISVYPNPTYHSISITITPASSKIKIISIYDVTGKPVKIIRGNLKHIDISELNSGVYLMKLELENGDQATKKIVKL
ncbi:T9SS type A sorting domain-containing protein [Winogradskyella aurantia]|uniref:Secretion system C-terminal sorting domain-containing protein n=1 Tax=Winogradskyella aurantia TaxID=1915063 RepID=A0A265UTF1_9FLAO|nr:T9SS type A sorting domain-containing protein [Winogradskyella aurantia]OZV68595.1 hypothetical protein CA834_08985 [Winogradskyella aurantia]